MLLMTGPDALDDWDLLNRISRNPQALESLFLRHRDFVYRLAVSRLGDPDLAQEVTQEVFYALARSRRRFFKGARFRTWLYRVVTNQVADLLRRREPQLPLPEDIPAPGPSQEIRSDLEQVLDALPSLPERQREVLVLRLLEGFSTEETADALRISQGSVKTHLHRATAALKRRFHETNPEEISS